jgi:hypothetical protein
MGARDDAEKFIEKGSWVEGYDPTYVRFPDGVSISFVTIDPQLKPRKKGVWLFFWQNARYTSDEFNRHMEQRYIAEWRRRMHNG